jgi:hypothetical protein
MADETKDSSRTKKIREAKIEDDTFGIKRALRAGALKASELGDRLGFTQEEEYKDKKPVKKKSGGSIKRYQVGGYVEPNYTFNSENTNREPQTTAPGGVTATEEKKPLINTSLLNIGQQQDQTQQDQTQQMRKGGRVKKKPITKTYRSGGTVSSASKRGDGCAQRGKTKGRMV